MDPWDFPAAHIVELLVQPQDIDAYGHVNNSVYLTWLDLAAWSHSAALGVPLEECVSSRRGMAAQRIEIDYLRAALAGDRVHVATWIESSDARNRGLLGDIARESALNQTMLDAALRGSVGSVAVLLRVLSGDGENYEL